ncbi:hypothetical protein HBN50_14115 [Halobacteriovorax sp. GB3]|uniref:hypothetical protein n=1 Tax=Halobacteriovorax sp. GB3 TaxID=2719615 RepID=UPI00235FBF11|nr:hypothetical protein [Halobacteriovorax sp. GB3]MDD0854244.1 hypothetical protein [Halobacteriovorax sp. GB3]
MISRLIVLSLFMFSITAFAQKHLITLNMSGVEDMSTSETTYIRKSAYEAIFSAKIFEISLGKVNRENKEGITWFEIVVDSKKLPNDQMNITFSLYERPTNEIINFVQEKFVKRSKVQFRARILMYKLLFGQYFDEKEEKLIEPKVIPLKKRQVKAKTPRPVTKRDKDEVAQEDTPQEEESEKVFNAKEREKKAKVAKEKEKIKPKKNKPTIQKFEAPNLDLRKSVASEKREPVSHLTWLSKYNFSIGQEDETVITQVNLPVDGIVETETSIKRIALKINAIAQIKEWDQHFQYGGVISKVISEDEYAVPARLSIYGNYNFNLYDYSLFASPSLEYETLGFVSLGKRGEDFQEYTNNILWAGIGGRFFRQIFNRVFSLEVDFKKAFIASSDIAGEGESVPLDGSKIMAETRFEIYKSWGLGFFYESVELTSVSISDFSNEHKMYGIRLTYN